MVVLYLGEKCLSLSHTYTKQLSIPSQEYSSRLLNLPAALSNGMCYFLEMGHMNIRQPATVAATCDDSKPGALEKPGYDRSPFFSCRATDSSKLTDRWFAQEPQGCRRAENVLSMLLKSRWPGSVWLNNPTTMHRCSTQIQRLPVFLWIHLVVNWHHIVSQ